MATAKVILENGLTHEGKAYAKGEEVKVNKDQLAIWERLGYVKVSAEKASATGTEKRSTSKGATKGQSATKKQSGKTKNTEGTTDAEATVEPIV